MAFNHTHSEPEFLRSGTPPKLGTPVGMPPDTNRFEGARPRPVGAGRRQEQRQGDASSCVFFWLGFGTQNGVIVEDSENPAITYSGGRP